MRKTLPRIEWRKMACGPIVSYRLYHSTHKRIKSSFARCWLNTIGFFETRKSFVAKLNVYFQDVQSSTFRDFKNLQSFLCDQEVDSSVIGGSMRELKAQFCRRFQDYDVLVKCF